MTFSLILRVQFNQIVRLKTMFSLIWGVLGLNSTVKNSKIHKLPTSRTVRVDIEKLDMLMNQVSELIIAKNSLVAMNSSDQRI